MSRSCVRLGIEFAMLDGHYQTCENAYGPSGFGTHQVFKFIAKTRVCGPGSWTLDDEKYTPEVRQELEKMMLEGLKKEIEFMDYRFLKTAIKSVFDQAEEHCRTVHKGLPAKEKTA